jgi:hypothetical protein
MKEVSQLLFICVEVIEAKMIIKYSVNGFLEHSNGTEKQMTLKYKLLVSKYLFFIRLNYIFQIKNVN